MLNNCDAGEYSVLTTYGNGFGYAIMADGDNEIMLSLPETNVSIQYVERIEAEYIGAETLLVFKEKVLRFEKSFLF